MDLWRSWYRFGFFCFEIGIMRNSLWVMEGSVWYFWVLVEFFSVVFFLFFVSRMEKRGFMKRR